MKKSIKNIICGVFVAVAAICFANPVNATPLPWLDFTGNTAWDGTVLTDSPEWTTFVTTSDGISLTDPVVGSFLDFNLSLSFDGDNSNDYFDILGWFEADVIITETSVDPTVVGTTTILLDNLVWTCGDSCGSSQWYNEFSSQVGIYDFDGQVNLAFLGQSADGTINVSGKLAPVPEPGTLLLLGSGLIGMVCYGRRKRLS